MILTQTIWPGQITAGHIITVIGAGIAGLKAALDLAERGIEVALIEKSPFLGGRVAQLNRLAPMGERAEEPITALTGQVLSHPRISVHNCAAVTGFEGSIGNFQLQVRRRPPESAEDLDRLDLVGKSGTAVGSFTPFAGVLPSAVPRDPQDFTVDTGTIVLATGFSSYQPRYGEYGFGDSQEVMTLPAFIRILAGQSSSGLT